MKMLEHWLPPADAGDPIACLATSFTFDADFFFDDCLSRFLALSGRDFDATGADIAGMIEEEERLAETRVSVLVDQSYQPEPRNLRWDLVPIRVPRGLLHAKVAILMWESTTRVLIGSANLTKAGYRRQVEVCAAIDLGPDCRVPRHVFDELNAELRDILALAPGSPNGPGPVQRATGILDEFAGRVASARLPDSTGGTVRMALAPSRGGTSPIDRLDAVWNGSKPQEVIALSPFWDPTPEMPGARKVLSKLADRAPSGGTTQAMFVVPVDPVAGVVQAPRGLLRIADKRIDTRVVMFKHDDADHRRLHAKCVQYRSASWSATLLGSSNITANGLGLNTSAHREINLWIGCRSDTDEHKALKGLIIHGPDVDPELEWEPAMDDEDEAQFDPLPPGFGEALIVARDAVELTFTDRKRPDDWKVEFAPVGHPTVQLLDWEQYLAAGSPATVVATLADGVLPSTLSVTWTGNAQPRKAAWFVNVRDPALLPPPADLRTLPVEVLLAVLATTRPLRVALEHALRAKGIPNGADDLDPLKRFDSSGLLLQRTRRTSAALLGIERRLNRPIPNLDSLEWRLAGTLGPEHVALKLVEEAASDKILVPGEAHFLLAELGLTVSRVPWTTLAGDIGPVPVRSRVQKSIRVIRDASLRLDSTNVDPSIRSYIKAALAEAIR
jgi:hypothetical protein